MALSTDQQPDDPCGCSSGLRYGECHKPIFDAPAGQVLKVAHRVYSETWAANADHYRDQGLYTTQADELVRKSGDISRLLDIGCGHGHGLQALRTALPKGAQLVGIDENPDCIGTASRLLDIVPLPQNINRMTDEELGSGHYRSTYRRGDLALQDGITLVQSDILLADEPFEVLLNMVGSLDAITLWFVGVHKARSFTQLGKDLKLKSDAHHRELVEDATLEIAKRRLRPGGFLQIVVRTGFDDVTVAKVTVQQTYGEWLGGTQFVLEAVTPRSYQEPGNGIKVRSLSVDVNRRPSFAVSLLIRKMR